MATPAIIAQDEVKVFLKSFVAAYEKGDPKAFFEHFAEDASIFTVSSPTRIDGVEEFRRGFEKNLTDGTVRRSQILSPEIKIAGTSAVVTYHNRIAVGDQTSNLRATLVLNKSGDRIEIVHQHNSPLASVGLPASRIPGVQDVTLLEERVATAAAAVGTPR
jgi:uncharacterized protein (TIGR02246 family)